MDIKTPRPKAKIGPWIDSHSHWASSKWTDSLRNQFYLEAKERGISYFVQAGVGPDDWKAQLDLSNQYPGTLGNSFGLHPEWISSVVNDVLPFHPNTRSSQKDPEEILEEAMNLLPQFLTKSLALGECGLDFRPHIVKESHDIQIDYFRQQLELASIADKPVILHLVQAHDEALRVLDFESNPRKGFVHGFNGSAHKAKALTDRGWSISVGASLLYPKNEKLRQAVREIPMEFLLIETDSPDQPPPDLKGQMNPFVTLLQVAEQVGRLRQMSMTEVLDISTENLKRILSLQENPHGKFEPIPRTTA